MLPLMAQLSAQLSVQRKRSEEGRESSECERCIKTIKFGSKMYFNWFECMFPNGMSPDKDILFYDKMPNSYGKYLVFAPECSLGPK